MYKQPYIIDNIILKQPFIIVGATVAYSTIDEHSHSRDVKHALDLLEKARIHTRIRATSGAGLPLCTYVNEKKFKVLFLDVGLLQNVMGISSETYLASDLLAVYRGAVTEQFIGQQLLALKKPFEDPELFFWHRNATGSEAEIDYLFQQGEKIIPIEVKAGKTGTLKSLHLFVKENHAPFGVRFSMHPLSFHDNVLSIPLYAVEAMQGLIAEAM